MMDKAEYDDMMRKMPIPCIDLAMSFPEGLLWIKRDNHPYKGYWAMPGGRIFKYETIDEAINRIAKKETGIDTSHFPRKLMGNYSTVNSMPDQTIIRHDITSLYGMNVLGEVKADNEQVQEFTKSNEMQTPIGELHVWEYEDMKRVGFI
jgi:ADP-ribose pyrophosphatase YjhB (NUDIX family)